MTMQDAPTYTPPPRLTASQGPPAMRCSLCGTGWYDGHEADCDRVVVSQAQLDARVQVATRKAVEAAQVHALLAVRDRLVCQADRAIVDAMLSET